MSKLFPVGRRVSKVFKQKQSDVSSGKEAKRIKTSSADVTNGMTHEKVLHLSEDIENNRGEREKERIETLETADRRDGINVLS